MRTFLIGMCDIFLILYLTAGINVRPPTVLTVDDFYELKSMHETLQADRQKAEEELKDKLRREREDKEILMAEKQKSEEELKEKLRGEQEEKEIMLAQKQEQEELAAALLKDLTGEKENLAAKLAEEKDRLGEMEQSLLSSDAERERMNKDLQEKAKTLKAREQMLANLNNEIADQEESWRKMNASYKKDLESQKETIETGRVMTEQLQDEVRATKLLAQKIQSQAREEKVNAERKAAEALAARQQAEAEKVSALKAAETAKADTKRAQQNILILSATVKEIKQDAGTAFENNIRSILQKVNVTYERKLAGGITRYERELILLPVKINDQIYGVFPSRQIGFSWRSDRAPDGLVIMYQDKKVTSGRINKDDDLIAIPLPGYEDDVYAPYPATTQVTEFMPILLALRNNGNVSLLDKVRGISDSYFIVNRDYLKTDKDHGFKYIMTGFPGTGTRAERIISGDQLVDLNGQLIGVANQANRVICINAMHEWDEIAF